MERFILVNLGLLAVALSLSGTAADPDCPFGWSSYNGHCYKVFQKFKKWHEAEMFCRQEQNGGHLASFHSWAESSYVARLVFPNIRFINVWIGLGDPWKNRNWEWSDGSQFHYKSWKQGEPNNFFRKEHCVELWFFSGYFEWNDEKCSSRRYFICKFQPEGEGSTW